MSFKDGYVVSERAKEYLVFNATASGDCKNLFIHYNRTAETT